MAENVKSTKLKSKTAEIKFIIKRYRTLFKDALI